MVKPTVLDVLREARRKITDPKNWCKGSYATLENGSRASCRSPAAACFCLYGALHAFVDSSFRGDVEHITRIETQATLHVARHLQKTTSYHSLEGFNDLTTTKHADVLALLDGAIAEFQKEQKR